MAKQTPQNELRSAIAALPGPELADIEREFFSEDVIEALMDAVRAGLGRERIFTSPGIVAAGSAEHRRRREAAVSEGLMTAEDSLAPAATLALRVFSPRDLWLLLHTCEPRAAPTQRETARHANAALADLAEWRRLRSIMLEQEAAARTHSSGLARVRGAKHAAAAAALRPVVEHHAEQVRHHRQWVDDLTRPPPPDRLADRRRALETLGADLASVGGTTADVASILIESHDWPRPPAPTFTEPYVDSNLRRHRRRIDESTLGPTRLRRFIDKDIQRARAARKKDKPTRSSAVNQPLV